MINVLHNLRLILPIVFLHFITLECMHFCFPTSLFRDPKDYKLYTVIVDSLLLTILDFFVFPEIFYLSWDKIACLYIGSLLTISIIKIFTLYYKKR